MTAFAFTRLALRLFALSTSAVVLGLSSYLLDQLLPSHENWNILAIVSSALTIPWLLTLTLSDLFRPNGFTTWSVPELLALGVLWPLWLGTASYEASVFGHLGGCGVSVGSYEKRMCRMRVALEACSVLTWISLLAIFIYILVLYCRGRPSFIRQPDREHNLDSFHGVLIQKRFSSLVSEPIESGAPSTYNGSQMGYTGGDGSTRESSRASRRPFEVY